MVVAGDPWQKRGEVVASPADRLALVAAAVEEVEGVEPSSVEIERGEPSVTYDTLSALAAPGASCSWCSGPMRSATCRRGASWRRPRPRHPRDRRASRRRARRAPAPAWRVERVTIHASTSRRGPSGEAGAGAPDRRARPAGGDACHRPTRPLQSSSMTTGRGLLLDRRPGRAPPSRRRRCGASAKKGEDIIALDVGDILSITDALVITSATNTARAHDRGRDRGDEGARLDATDERRRPRRRDLGVARLRRHRRTCSSTRPAYYELERLWADAPGIDWENVLASAERAGTGAVGQGRC